MMLIRYLNARRQVLLVREIKMSDFVSTNGSYEPIAKEWIRIDDNNDNDDKDENSKSFLSLSLILLHYIRT